MTSCHRGTIMRLNFTQPLLFSTLLLIPASYATNLFSTGFEPPTYTTGPLNGQGGWTNTTPAVVENSVVFAGSQAVAIDSTGASQSIFGQGLNYNSAVDPNQVVVFDVEFMESATGNDPTWDIFVVDGNAGFIDQLAVRGQVVAFGTNTTVSITPGVWNDFQMVLNFSNQTVDAYLNSVFVSEGNFGSPSTTITAFGAGINSTFNGPDTATAYFDNFSVTSVSPEPGSAIFVLVGTAVLVPLVRRRLKKAA
jgi:hypothetical protein